MHFPQVDSETLDAALDKLSSELKSFLQPKAHVALVGIANGGIPLARLLAERMGGNIPVGVVNSSFHRDDVTLKLLPTNFALTDLDFEIDGATIVLVDDVFATGRTVRAALNELFDYGRPEEVRMATLVDIGQKKLPLQPDFVGLYLELEPGQKVKVCLSADDASAHTIELEASSKSFA
ncbi:MAG: bifunctional pyr operon transcriptional regulator/uracil phosphoribosyltransferase PyrR [Verrucomicrobiota bacterium JB022]|nr:bifunctional pyr operon transcriptional regulator/uracil phosphoribosyltransferase PyrR [Verrucomicrobiota bacterium JB022]